MPRRGHKLISLTIRRKLLWRKITFSRPSSANTLHSVTAQFLTASQQPPPPSTPPPSTPHPSTLPPSTLPPSTPHPSKPHQSTLPPSTPHQSTPQQSTLPPSTPHPSTPHQSTPPSSTPPPSTPRPSTSPPSTSPPSTPSLSTSPPSTPPPTQFSTHPPLLPIQLLPHLFTSPNKGSDSLPGFVGHASTINAFSATATSKPSSAAKTKHSSAQQAQPTEDSDVVSLSDSDGSPAPKRPKHIPSIEENHLAKQLERCKTVPYNSSKLDFSNNFLLQLAHPMKWTTTYHMEILMHMLAARYSLLFEEQKLAFITPHLTSGIQAISKAFNKSRKRDTFEWDEQLTGLVLQPGKKWMEDVLTVYTPMIWGDKHWVGLAINLDLGCVEVLDPLPTLYKDSAVGRFMAPVLKVLPYLVKKVANYELTQFRGLAPFTCHRIKDLYINERGGDCGPVSVKFLEMQAQGDPDHMSSITD
ncbi:unnamed protein product, partial [Brassica rapa]